MNKYLFAISLFILTTKGFSHGDEFDDLFLDRHFRLFDHLMKMTIERGLSLESFLSLARAEDIDFEAEPPRPSEDSLAALISNLNEYPTDHQWIRLKWGPLIAWIYEKQQERGSDWVVATLGFELAEHSILWWIPPGFAACEIFQLLYLTTSGTAWRIYGVQRSKPFGERLPITSFFKLLGLYSLYRQDTNTLFDSTLDKTASWKEYKKELRKNLNLYQEKLSATEMWIQNFGSFKESEPFEENFLKINNGYKFLEAHLRDLYSHPIILNYLLKADPKLYERLQKTKLIGPSSIEDAEEVLETVENLRGLITKQRNHLAWEQRWARERSLWQESYKRFRMGETTEQTSASLSQLTDVSHLTEETHLLSSQIFRYAHELLATIDFQKTTLSLALYEAFEHGHMDRLRYYELKKDLGKVGRILHWDFHSALYAISLSAPYVERSALQESLLRSQDIILQAQLVLKALYQQISSDTPRQPFEQSLQDLSKLVAQFKRASKPPSETAPKDQATTSDVCKDVFISQ